jgi:hypothetical protein
MAGKALIEKNKKLTARVAKHAEHRAQLKRVVRSPGSSPEERRGRCGSGRGGRRPRGPRHRLRRRHRADGAALRPVRIPARRPSAPSGAGDLRHQSARRIVDPARRPQEHRRPAHVRAPAPRCDKAQARAGAPDGPAHRAGIGQVRRRRSPRCRRLPPGPAHERTSLHRPRRNSPRDTSCSPLPPLQCTQGQALAG